MTWHYGNNSDSSDSCDSSDSSDSSDSKTQLATKLKNSNCERKKLQRKNSPQTFFVTKILMSKTQIVTKLKNSNGD